MLILLLLALTVSQDGDMVLTHIDGNKHASREEIVKKDVKIEWVMPKRRKAEIVEIGKEEYVEEHWAELHEIPQSEPLPKTVEEKK